MRRAGAGDREAVQAFLDARAATSMFPLINLRDHGWESDALNGMRFWLREDADGITDVLGVTNEGMVMPQCPTLGFEGVAEALAGISVVGFIGVADQVRPLQAMLGMKDVSATLDRDEPFMILDLAEIRVPEGAGAIVPIADAPKDVILKWMIAYQYEALHTPEGEAEERAAGSYERYCARGSHAVLMDGDVPLAMTGFNARLPEIVQIGGVYTPPELRNRGHARRAVALHLQESAADGAKRSVLFSGSDAAQRSYEAIGFRQRGAWSLCLLKGAQVIHG